MRVFLVNANRFKQPWPVIPIGICCLASALKKANHIVKVADLCFSRKPEADLAESITAFAPEVVGFSIRNLDNCSGYRTKFLLNDIRDRMILPLKRLFSGPIIIGGAAVGISASEMLKFFDLPYAIRGDGELAMIEFLKRLHKGESLHGVAGLVEYRRNKIVQDNPPMIIHDLDSLEFSRCWKWIDLKPYQRTGSPLLIQTKRGCALTCSYCTYNRIEGYHWRLRSPRKVVDEIEEAVQETGIRQFEVTDSTFNIPMGHAKAVLREIIARKLDIRLQVMGINPGAVDWEFVSLLKQAGFKEVDLGVESGCDETLKGLGKNFDIKTIRKAGELMHKAGIAVRSWALLLGGPNETPETVMKTLDTIRQAAGPWDLVDIGVGLRMYNGAPISIQAKREDPSCTDDHFFSPVTYVPGGITAEEIKALVKREALKHRNFYMYGEEQNNSLFLIITVTWLMRFFAPKQPIWRVFIVMRTIEMWTGVNFIRRMLHEIKCYNIFSDIKKRSLEGPPSEGESVKKIA